MAAGLAAEIEKSTGLAVKLVEGRPGQFDVFADGENIATRSKGWVRFFGGGWPDPSQVVATLRERLGEPAAPP